MQQPGNEYKSIFPPTPCSKIWLWKVLAASIRAGRVAKGILIPDLVYCNQGRLFLVQSDGVSGTLECRELQSWAVFSSLVRESVGRLKADHSGADFRSALVASVFYPGIEEATMVSSNDISRLPTDTEGVVVVDFPRELMKYVGNIRGIFVDGSLRGGESTVQLEFESLDIKGSLPENTRKHLNGKIEVIDQSIRALVEEALSALQELVEAFFSVKVDFIEAKFVLGIDGKPWLLSVDQLGFYPAIVSDIIQTVRCPGRLCNVACLQRSNETVGPWSSEDFGQEVEDLITGNSNFVSDALKRYGYQRILCSPDLKHQQTLCKNCISARTAIFIATKLSAFGEWGRFNKRLIQDLISDENVYRQYMEAKTAHDRCT